MINTKSIKNKRMTQIKFNKKHTLDPFTEENRIKTIQIR